jgi:hypothetical protein
MSVLVCGIRGRRDDGPSRRPILDGCGAGGRLQCFGGEMRRLPGQCRASRCGCAAAGSVPQLVVPLSTLDALEMALQPLVAVLLQSDLLRDLVAVRRV